MKLEIDVFAKTYRALSSIEDRKALVDAQITDTTSTVQSASYHRLGLWYAGRPSDEAFDLKAFFAASASLPKELLLESLDLAGETIHPALFIHRAKIAAEFQPQRTLLAAVLGAVTRQALSQAA
jgi:Tfp pilus assembly protein PilO